VSDRSIGLSIDVERCRAVLTEASARRNRRVLRTAHLDGYANLSNNGLRLESNIDMRPFLALLILSRLVSPTLCQVVSGGVAQQAAPDQPGSSGVTWSLAATGDTVSTRRVSVYESDPAFKSLVNVIRAADAGFTNLEISLFRMASFQGYPQAESGGIWFIGPPEAAQDLKWMGFNLFNRANNHATEYGVEGMIETDRLLDSLSLVHAGSGMTLGDATQARYLDTSKGRFALIGLATTFTPMSRAADPRPGAKGRPGINTLRVERKYELDPQDMKELRQIMKDLGEQVPQAEGAALEFADTKFAPGNATRVVERVDPRDEERILRSVRNASKQSDFVIVTSHSHEPSEEALTAPSFLVEFSKKCIDAGADAFIVHGPHQLRGIEIYKGKPVFYSLGNFIFQNETSDNLPSDLYESYALGEEALPADLMNARYKNGTVGFPASSIWYESVVAVLYFKGHQLSELRLYPIDLGQKAPRSQRGTPRLANKELAQQIIQRLAALSAPFETKITFEDGLGIWQRK
jgi:poly-gamma-glutamate capsule biosynthesis protein CapA/YwtB (metallophosphatase superfamily)